MFNGCHVALTTPFNEKGIDTQNLKKAVFYCINSGVKGLVPCGTTGESATISDAEYEKVVKTVVRAADGSVPVIAGCGSNCTETTIARGKIARDCGVEALLVVTPYYNKPGQLALLTHFTTVASALEMPIILYNVPSRTGCDLLPTTVSELALHPHIVGIKEATGSLQRACEILHGVPDDFIMLSGDDFTALPFVLMGGHGVISVAANAAPGLMSSLIDNALTGNITEARKLNKILYPFMSALFMDTNPVPVKAAMKLLGMGNGNPRLPLIAMAPEMEERLETVMRELRLL